jgi:hypothetical protein
VSHFNTARRFASVPLQNATQRAYRLVSGTTLVKRRAKVSKTTKHIANAFEMAENEPVKHAMRVRELLIL